MARIIIRLCLALLCAAVAFAQLATKKTLTLDAARKIAAAAEAEAMKNSWNVVIAIAVPISIDLNACERPSEVRGDSLL